MASSGPSVLLPKPAPPLMRGVLTRDVLRRRGLMRGVLMRGVLVLGVFMGALVARAEQPTRIPFNLDAVFASGFDDARIEPYLNTNTRTGSARLLIDGAQSFEARERIARSATRTLYIQQLYWPISLRTARMLAIAAGRVEAGVIVRVFVDRLATGHESRPWLEEFNTWVRRRYLALSDTYPRFRDELARTERSVRLFSAPEHTLENTVWWHDSKQRVLERRHLSVPRLGRANLLHFLHGKMIVADGERAVTGGMNQSDFYAARGRLAGEPLPLTSEEISALRRAMPETWPQLEQRFAPGINNPELWHDMGWRDTDIEVHGPVVGDLVRSFERMWALARSAEPTTAGETLATLGVAPPPPWTPARPRVTLFPGPEGPPYQRALHEGVSMRMVEHVPRLAENYMLRQFRWLFGAAKHHVLCHMPYMLLPPEAEAWIIAAARRGVKIILVNNSPQSNDINRAVAWSARTHYEHLMRGGRGNIHIYEWQTVPLHSKICVADSKVTTIGSNNHDLLSQYFPSELGITVLDEGFTREAERVVYRDLWEARRVTPAEAQRWRRRVQNIINIGSPDFSAVGLAQALNVIASPFMRDQVAIRSRLLSL